MTKKLFYDPIHWKERAEDARRVAAEILDPISRRAMLDIAESYERLGRRALERAESPPREPPSVPNATARDDP
jgi:hypothetical protein